jgi:hypothetical protein
MQIPERIYPRLDRALLEPLGMMIATCNHVEFYLAYGYWLMHSDEMVARAHTMRKTCDGLRKLFGDAFRKARELARGTVYEPEAAMLDARWTKLDDELKEAFEERSGLVHCAWIISGRGDMSMKIQKDEDGVPRMMHAMWTPADINAVTDKLAALAARTLDFVIHAPSFAGRVKLGHPPASLPPAP